MVTIGLIFVEAAHENVYELLLRQINFTTPSNEFPLLLKNSNNMFVGTDQRWDRPMEGPNKGGTNQRRDQPTEEPTDGRTDRRTDGL